MRNWNIAHFSLPSVTDWTLFDHLDESCGYLEHFSVSTLFHRRGTASRVRATAQHWPYELQQQLL